MDRLRDREMIGWMGGFLIYMKIVPLLWVHIQIFTWVYITMTECSVAIAPTRN